MGNTTDLPNLLFVVGAPRSGTKLLRHLLNRHVAIAMTSNETEFLPYLMRFEETGGLARAGGLARLMQYLQREDYFWHRIKEGHKPTDFSRLQASCAGVSATDVFREFLTAEVGDLNGLSFVGDKSPGYIRSLPKILVAFPDAKVVNIVRDPRAQCGSLRATFGKPIYASAKAWALAVSTADTARAQHPTRVFNLRYEDLTDAPEHWMIQICAFLNVSFNPDMLQVDVELENARAGAKPVALRKADKQVFEEYLSVDEIALVEGICMQGMSRHGYDLRGHATKLQPQSEISAVLDRMLGLARLALLTVRRHGWGALVRKIRLAHARRAIMAGRW